MLSRACTPRRAVGLAVLMLPLLLARCATVSLREAMGRIQEIRDRQLYPELEAGSSFGARDAVAELRKALQAPSVAATSPHASDPEYRTLLEEMLRSLDQVETAAKRFDKLALAELRPSISAACDGCHDRFRRRD